MAYPGCFMSHVGNRLLRRISYQGFSEITLQFSQKAIYFTNVRRDQCRRSDTV
jgi:hypothetical protein